MKSSASQSKPFQSRSKGEIPGWWGGGGGTGGREPGRTGGGRGTGDGRRKGGRRDLYDGGKRERNSKSQALFFVTAYFQSKKRTQQRFLTSI